MGTDTQLRGHIDVALLIPLPILPYRLDHILVPFPHAPAIRTRHLGVPPLARLPPLRRRPRLKAPLVHILPARRATPHNRLPAPALLHFTKANRTIPLDRLALPAPNAIPRRTSIPVPITIPRNRRRPVKNRPQLPAQQRQLVDMLVPGAQHPRQHVHDVLALVALAGVRAVAARLLGDGHGVDVARRPRQLDGFLRAGGGAVAGARDDVEALGGGAVVEFLEGFGGLGAESGRGVSSVGVIY